MDVIKAIYPPVILPSREGGFDSKKWLHYFQQNKLHRSIIDWNESPELAEHVKSSLVKSLQIFQVGETGNGEYLRNFASATQDPAYIESIDYFVKEEQEHARLLAQVIKSLRGNLLNWHWTDFAFVSLRRLFGLKTEIFILFIAEIIGKSFYQVVSLNIEDPQLAKLFSQIVSDEVGHIEFHCEYLRYMLGQYSPLAKRLTIFIWSAIFHCACLVFIVDHRNALKNLETTPVTFFSICSRLFSGSMARIIEK